MSTPRKVNDLPIGVFDSGVGGLTVVKEIIRQLPGEDIIYFGDTARVPYGSKSPDTIRHFAMQNSRFLADEQVKLIVVACNTVSSNAMDLLRRNFTLPFIDVLAPNAEIAARTTRNNRIGIIGTHATIESGSYERVIIELNSNAQIFAQPAPLLVPLAEEGWTEHKSAQLILNEYLGPLIDRDIDTLILGCTHYPLFEGLIREICGEGINVINSSRHTAQRVAENLKNNNNLSGNEKGDITFCLSDIPRNFYDIAERFLMHKISKPVRRINIEAF